MIILSLVISLDVGLSLCDHNPIQIPIKYNHESYIHIESKSYCFIKTNFKEKCNYDLTNFNNRLFVLINSIENQINIYICIFNGTLASGNTSILCILIYLYTLGRIIGWFYWTLT